MRKIKKVETTNEGNRLVGKFVYEEDTKDCNPFDSILKPEDLRPVSEEKEKAIKNQIAASMVEYYNKVFERAATAGSTEAQIRLLDWVSNHVSLSYTNPRLNEDVFDELFDCLKKSGYSLVTLSDGNLCVSWDPEEKK